MRPTGLQWGRDQLIAEMRHSPPEPPHLAAASMGPRSADRGNELDPVRHRRRESPLQWGRDQLIAEMTLIR